MIDFLGIGAQKAGTTWLWSNLRRHPDIYTPEQKELHFWNKAYPKKQSSVQDYLGLFAGKGRRKAGEITPAYSHIGLDTIRQVRGVNDRLRLIYVLRNPIHRAYSHAVMRLKVTGHDPKNTSDDWFKEFFHSKRCVRRSAYLDNLIRWRSVFDEGQLLILKYDLLCQSPTQFLIACALHIGVDPRKLDCTLVDERIGHAAGSIRPSLIGFLQELYRSQIHDLSAYLGEDLTHWCA